MDQIADMIVRIKNAGDSKKDSVVFHYSKMKSAILDCLLKEGFIKSFGKKGKKVVKYIEVALSYDENGNSMVHGVKRVSKLGKRVYTKSGEIRKVKNGLGILVISTPKGIMSDKEAKTANLGGEALFEIW
ncbi:MAG TPA: 30S ribosomal protein S8 [Candidatus Paceibacterota bacterium]